MMVPNFQGVHDFWTLSVLITSDTSEPAAPVLCILRPPACRGWTKLCRLARAVSRCPGAESSAGLQTSDRRLLQTLTPFRSTKQYLPAFFLQSDGCAYAFPIFALAERLSR
jgi:hypothetical protein